MRLVVIESILVKKDFDGKQLLPGMIERMFGYDTGCIHVTGCDDSEEEGCMLISSRIPEIEIFCVDSDVDYFGMELYNGDYDTRFLITDKKIECPGFETINYNLINNGETEDADSKD